jgi:hypothetical protein
MVSFYDVSTKLNGIAHEYAWLDKHPNVRAVVVAGFELSFLGLIPPINNSD